MKNKLYIIIAAILIVIVITLIYIFSIKREKSELVFTLNGQSNMAIEYGTQYIDPGFVAKDGNNDISDKVIIKGYVNSFVTGTYEIVYELQYNDTINKLTRTVTVNDVSSNKIAIILNGDETLYLLKGSQYAEKGAYVVNTANNEILEFNVSDITGKVDTEKVGVYDITYSYTYNDESINKTRKIEVFDISHTLNPNTITTDKVTIKIDLSSINSYLNIKLPDGTVSTDKQIEYAVSKNGSYDFIITFKNGSTFDKIVEVKNITSNYKCSGTITRDGTKITVTPTTSDAKEYEWIINNNTYKGTSTYSEYKIIEKASVNVIFEDGQKKQVNCSIEDNLIYHFNYDITKGHQDVVINGIETGKLGGKYYFYKCDLYTASDKKKYDKMLKNAIKEAGYGTRAGVVEAARFMMGGMKYMVGYQSPKKGHPEIGSYPYVGLNIGQNGAWGCDVSGYTQGLDCTNFIEWLMVQNGLKINAYNEGHQPVRDVVDKLRVGDFLYTYKPETGITHVAFVIGVDDNNIYYAEGGGGITKQTKKAMKKKSIYGGLSRAYFPKYPKNGDVKNLWLTK